MSATPALPADEGKHEPDDHPLWSESWYLDFVDPARGIGGYVRLGLYPNQRTAWYWACVIGPGRQLVTVVDHEVPVPKGRSHEIRTEGLWADYTVETPLDHVSVGLEAFAVGVDDPAEAYGDLRGDRVPLGFDLEWETVGSTFAYPGVTRYEVPCRVHGEVLVGAERIELDGIGQRDHSWGARDWWSYAWSWTAGGLDDGTRFHGVDVALGPTPLYGTGYVQAPDGAMHEVGAVANAARLGPAGLPSTATWTLGDLELQVEPVAFAPVLLTEAVATSGEASGPPRQSRFPRAWCRFTAADGRTGHGWTEWNQPQP